jgi:predicted glycoside hydrolase/deacetylase ChbG (UPF0249 family)
MINADDFGNFQCSNAAIMELLTDEKSALTSSTIMAPCAWAAQACRFAAKNPELAIGVHLTFTSEWSGVRWAPVAQGDTSSLRDEEGFFWHTSADVENHADLAQIEREIRAQIARCKALGVVNPSHLDNHMGSLYGIATGRWELLATTLKVVAEYGLPFRLPTSIADISFDNSTLGIATDASLTAAAAKPPAPVCLPDAAC